VRVRAAGARDLDRVAALASLLFAQHAEGAAHFALAPGREGELRGLLAGFLRDPSHRLLVAEAPGGNLLGFALATIARRPGLFVERERGEIEWLIVREEARRRGAGRALAGAALGWLRGRGVARVEVQVARANPAGLAFWRALGFAPSMDVLDLRL
jgi:ribosomal protein S18 acetylase RimI-like enzyme